MIPLPDQPVQHGEQFVPLPKYGLIIMRYFLLYKIFPDLIRILSKIGLKQNNISGLNKTSTTSKTLVFSLIDWFPESYRKIKLQMLRLKKKKVKFSMRKAQLSTLKK